MKIDAYYVLAPLPKSPAPPPSSRRAFLMGSSLFLAGAAVGSACGYTVGAAGHGEAGSGGAANGAGAAAPGDGELTPSGDVELDQLRWLAAKAPLDELFSKAMFLLHSRAGAYPQDAILWRGVDRLTAEIVANPRRDIDESLLVVLVAQIEGTARPESPSLRERVPALKARRAEIRRRR
jgi:hypothetical protein